MPVAVPLVLLAAACSAPTGPTDLTFAAYTTPREAYGELLPAFARSYEAATGRRVTFQESYQASGAQSRAVAGGFEADVVALSLEANVQRLVDAGLVPSDWRDVGDGGMVTRSLVVIAVRPGNPKGIHDWSDLARPGVQVLTPNVRTSGGAIWNVAALYGAATRGAVPGVDTDPASVEAFVASVLHNVPVMDKGARESMLHFGEGIGDAAITYENEVVVARAQGDAMDYVVPSSTILIENPAATVDGYAGKHGMLEPADALVAWLHEPEAQATFTRYGLRPVDATVPVDLPVPADVFTIRDLGGWDGLDTALLAEGALYDRALARATTPR